MHLMYYGAETKKAKVSRTSNYGLDLKYRSVQSDLDLKHRDLWLVGCKMPAG